MKKYEVQRDISFQSLPLFRIDGNLEFVGIGNGQAINGVSLWFLNRDDGSLTVMTGFFNGEEKRLIINDSVGIIRRS